MRTKGGGLLSSQARPNNFVSSLKRHKLMRRHGLDCRKDGSDPPAIGLSCIFRQRAPVTGVPSSQLLAQILEASEARNFRQLFDHFLSHGSRSLLGRLPQINYDPTKDMSMNVKPMLRIERPF